MRKLKFEDPVKLNERIDKYFDNMKREERPPTMSGLALTLGTTRWTLLDYINECKAGGKGTKAECGELLVMAKARIENWLEEELVTRAKPAGIQFALQNGYAGWGAKTEARVEAKVEQKTDQKAISLTDEELIHQLAVLTAKTMEIMKKEGAASGTDGR